MSERRRQPMGTSTVIRANARALPIADSTVDLVVTSPPYFALRSYTDAGEHYAGQVGDEPTPQEFLDSLIEVTRECVRVLKPSGSLWVNLGDKYAERGGPARQAFADGGEVAYRAARPRRRGEAETGIRQKSLMGLPWRYAIRCIDELGLILRSEVVWSKPNGLPESVTDRVRRSHEQWFHFTLEPRYFSAVDEIREAHTWTPSPGWAGPAGRSIPGQPDHQFAGGFQNPLGKLPGSVWTIATEPLKVPAELGVDHFAAFPTEWPRRIINGWSPAEICDQCGEGRRPITDSADFVARSFAGRQAADSGRNWKPGDPAKRALGVSAAERDRRITSYACGCAEPTPPTRPAVVLDPFGGTGTTAMVAKALGRHGITVDMSADYCRLAEWRTTDRDQLAKVLGVSKAMQQPPDQLDIFAELAGGVA